LEALLLPREELEEPVPKPELESPLLLPKPELERPLLPKPELERPLLPRREELPKPLLPKVEPVWPVPPWVELEKLLSLEEEELEEVHLDWLFTPLEVPENWTEVAGPLDTDPWKVVTGLPLVRVAPEDKPEPPMAAAIAELMEGPREPITLARRASSLPPSLPEPLGFQPIGSLVGAAVAAPAQASMQRSW
jgi:hypothetical protein